VLETALKTVSANLGALLKASFRRRRHHCVYCNAKVLTFLPYKGGSSAAPAVVATTSMIGSDLDNFSCWRCGSTDRERHLLLYLRELGKLELFTGARILHFAPEARLSLLLKEYSPADYVKADLFPNQPDIIRVNMEAIDFPDQSFDFVIANHVLEHVSDDQQALREVARVLAPNGTAILQTPYAAANEHTQEDPAAASSAKLKLELYGQEDHVRLFGTDIFERIQKAGLESEIATHDETLSQYDPQEYGVNKSEPFMCFRKP
jgi:SAM-dependent methyltransferase